MRTSAAGRVDRKNGNGFKTQEYGMSFFGESRKSLEAKLQVEDTQRQVCVNYLERCSAFYHGPLTSVCTTQLKAFLVGVAHYQRTLSLWFKFRLGCSALRGGIRIFIQPFHQESNTKRPSTRLVLKTHFVLCSLKVTLHYLQFHNYDFPPPLKTVD